jgi:putative FmdB family regulatory protein
MPIFRYKCPHCGNEEERIVKFKDRDEQLCYKCELETNYQPSFRFNGHGLPNGFANTRSKSRKNEDK